MKSVLSAAAGLCAAGALTGCVVVDSQAHIAREEKRFEVSGPPQLTLTTFDGAIELHSGDVKTVVVEIEKRGPTKEGVNDLRVETTQDGNHITVEVKRPSHEVVFFGIGVTPTASLKVTMPREGNVTAKSGDGSITIDGIGGRFDLHTGDGSIRCRNVGGQMTFVTGDGSVTLESAAGTVDGETGDGSVSVSGGLTAVKLRTGDGSITFHADSGTKMSGDWSFTTGDGSVAVYLPPDFAAELDAHTGDGSIRNELSVAAEADDSKRRDRDDDEERRTLRTRLGAGGKTLKIRTGDGSIKLRAS
jgi:putative adhesin